MIAKRCGTCRYYELHADDAQTGNCYRFPPTPYYDHHPQVLEVVFQHPTVHEHDRCGEWSKAKTHKPRKLVDPPRGENDLRGGRESFPLRS